MDDATRALLRDVRRDVDDSAEEISQAVERAEADDAIPAEALLGEAMTRLRLLSQRLDRHLGED